MNSSDPFTVIGDQFSGSPRCDLDSTIEIVVLD